MLVSVAAGGPVVQYIWDPRRLAGFRAVPGSAVALTAESAQSWAYFSYRLPQLIRVAFGPDGTLPVTLPVGTINAKR